MFADTHCHLYKEYFLDLDNTIKRASNLGVDRIISDADDIKSCYEMLELAKDNDNIYITLGIHPQNEHENLGELKSLIENNLSNPKFIAIGEIGLDYHYDNIDALKQLEIFKFQLELAQKYNKPVVIHSRDATNDTINTLKKYNVKGVIHCFSGSYETALQYIKMGYLIGVGGVVTFKNAKISSVIQRLPLESIVLETDAPFLAPTPHRGEVNEPAFVLETAKYVADLKGVSLEELSSITNQNIKKIFGI